MVNSSEHDRDQSGGEYTPRRAVPSRNEPNLENLTDQYNNTYGRQEVGGHTYEGVTVTNSQVHLGDVLYQDIPIWPQDNKTFTRHKYGGLIVSEGSQVLAGNYYGHTNIFRNSDFLHDDLNVIRNRYSNKTRLTQRIIRFQNQLSVQQRTLQDSLYELVDAADLVRPGHDDSDDLEVLIGLPENVDRLEQFFGSRFRFFKVIVEAIDAALQAIGSSIASVADQDYSNPGSWNILVQKLKQYTPVEPKPPVKRSLLSDVDSLPPSRHEVAAAIMADLNRVNSKVVQLAVQVQRLTNYDGDDFSDIASTTGSVYTVESRPIESYLYVLVRNDQNSLDEHLEEALLDTGATHDCISKELADRLHLTIAPGQAVVSTAVFEQDLSTVGTVKAFLKWQDRMKIFREEAKPVLHVVEKLSVALLLSNGFMNEHEDSGIWEVCEQREATLGRLAPFRLRKLKDDEQEAETKAQSAVKDKNKLTEEDIKKAKIARLEAWFQEPTTDDNQGSTNS